jgi:toxin ParE1/3/4
VKIRFTPSARIQFLEGLEYIARNRPNAARRLRVRAEAALRRLERFPNSGRRIPEFADLPHREVVLHPFRFFYRVDKKVIWVVAVWHDARSPKAP